MKNLHKKEIKKLEAVGFVIEHRNDKNDYRITCPLISKGFFAIRDDNFSWTASQIIYSLVNSTFYEGVHVGEIGIDVWAARPENKGLCTSPDHLFP